MVFLCLLVSLLVMCVGLRSLRLITWVTAQFGPVSLWRHMSSRLAKLAAQVQILHQDLQMLVALDSQKHPWNDPVIMIHSAYVNNIYLYNIYICVCVCMCIYICVCVDYIYIWHDDMPWYMLSHPHVQLNVRLATGGAFTIGATATGGAFTSASPWIGRSIGGLGAWDRANFAQVTRT